MGLAESLCNVKRKKFGKVMHEFKSKKLHHGSTGKVVTDVNVAKAIAASEAGLPPQKKR